MTNPVKTMAPVLASSLLLLFAPFALAVDADGDGADSVEEALAGTSDNDPALRPYWWKTIYGDSIGDQFGRSVSVAGDINGDGYADVIVGTPLDDNNGANSGSARVFSGVNGSILYTFNGDSVDDRLGYSVSGAGDVNNDGYADVIVGAYQDDNNGSTSGSARVFSGVNGSILYTFNGDSAGDLLGYSVSGAGDVNNDGYADVIVGAYQDDNNGTNSGSARVFSGVDGSILYTFNGDSANDRFGWSVSGAGDVNGDGYADVIAGAYFDDNNGSNSGSARIFSGVDGAILYTFNGDSTLDQLGISVSGAGDANNDGYADVIVGADLDDNNGPDSGSARVFSGANGAMLYTFNGDGDAYRFGASVRASGDVNGDSYDDVIIGAWGSGNNGGNSGSALVFSGIDGSLLYTFNGLSGGDVFGDSIAAGDMDGDGLLDFVIGAPLDGTDPAGQNDEGSIRIILGVDLLNDPNLDFVIDWLPNGDNDGDGIINQVDNCRTIANAEQLNNDGDAQGDVCDTDDDNDGMPDTWENSYGLDPFNATDATGNPDGDYANNLEEYQGATNPLVYDANPDDADGDGLDNGVDNCPAIANADQLNNDGDAQGDVCDADDDNDGMPDAWELTYGLNPLVNDAGGDVDGDGATNLQEYQNGFDPLVIDNDGDSDSVNDLVDNCPAIANADQLNNEGDAQGDVCDADDDNDGMPDTWENTYGLNPLVNDAAGDIDGDGVNNLQEYLNGTNPGVLVDVDGDGSSYEEETLAGTSDNDATRRPYWWRTFSGDSANDLLGYSVSGAGDVNGDGYGDLIVGAPFDDNNGNSSGSARVLSGVDGSILYTFNGDSANDNFGYSVSGAGDVNGDGYGDLIVGTPFDDNNGTDSGSARIFSGVNGAILYTFNGDSAGDQLGYSVSGAGDVNGDGYADLIVGAPFDDNNGNSSGSARVLSGVDDSILYTFNGDSAGDQLGYSVSGAGDVNLDGYADMIVGAYLDDNNGNGSGSARIFSGVNGAILYTFNGDSAGDQFGYSVSSAGDVNLDGYADVIMGAPLDDNNGDSSGSARVFSGMDGSILYTFNGDSASDNFGWSVSGAGDVNGDGYADLIVGAHFDDNNGTDSGSARILSGVDGSTLYLFHGDSAGDRLGYSVSGAVDMNNDGYGDLIVSAYRDDNNGSNSGSARVLLSSGLVNDRDLDFIVNSADPDSDSDGMPDVWELTYGLNPLVNDAGGDLDGDGATNLQEYQNGFDPLVIDNDGDSDGVNSLVDNCPAIANIDQLNNEGDAQGDVCDADDDNDGMPDAWEILYGLNPLVPSDASGDTDDDGDSNLWEYQNGTNPLVLNDADNDGSYRYEESLTGTSDSDAALRPYWWRTFNGDSANDNFGYSGSGAGDVNGDGYADLIVGAPFDDNNGASSGSARVLSGADHGILYTFNGDNAGDRLGVSVSAAGDVNGDGYADVIVGADWDDNNGDFSGGARVFSGVDGSILYTFNGDGANDYFGHSVSGAGDVNGDGYADIIVGAHLDDNNGDDSGSARMFSGVDGSILYTFNGDNAGDVFGGSVSGAGDVNGDGYADVIVGALMDDNSGINSGSARVFSGIDGSTLYTFHGDSANDRLGSSVSGAGDVNNDGYADVVVGAYADDNNGDSSGSARVLSGVDGSILYTFNGDGADDLFGYSVSGAGDVNNDGYADVIVGADRDDNNGSDSGSARVFSGANGATLYTFNGDSASDQFGISVSGAGDVNGDGYGDLIVGAYLDDNKGSASGSARVFLSSDLMNDRDLDLTVNSADPDDDNDGMPDAWEILYGLNPLDPSDANEDMDGDAINNRDEYFDNTDPTLPSPRLKNDFGGDGKADVLMRNKNTGEWYMAELDGTSILGQSIVSGPFLNVNHATVSTGDLDGDGDADILTRGTASGLVPGRFRVELTDGRTYTGAAWMNAMSSNLDDVVVSTRDFNRDGKADVLLRNSSTGVWTLNLMNGTGAPAIGTLNATTDLAYTFRGDGDYDGNGFPDLLLRRDNGGFGNWMVVELDGDMTIEQSGLPSSMATSSIWQPVVTDKDFNGDGRDDVLLRQNYSTVQQWFVYLMDGVSAPSDSGLINMATSNQWQIASDADFNGDGKADIMLRSTVTGQWYGYLLDGKAINSSSLLAMIIIKDWELKTIDDHNGDGKGDILLRDKVSGQWLMHLMDGLTVQQRTVLPILYSLDYELQNK